MPHATSPIRRLAAWLVSPPGWIAVAFVASRLLAAAFGVRFDMQPLPYFFQYLAADWLRHRLLESLWYLHGQPPGFNLFLGLVLKAFPGHEAAAFQVIYLGLGLVFVYAAYGLMGRLGVPRRLAAGLAIAFAVSPACLLYEHWLFYAYPVATALCLAAWCLHRYVERLRWRDGAVFFALLAAVALTRSLYHLGWLILVAGAVALAVRRRPGGLKTTLLAAAGPILLVTLLFAKNYAVFGTFSASSWFGMSFAKTTLNQLYGEEKMALYRRGLIAKTSLYPPFHALSFYPSEARTGAPTGIPALDAEWKPGGFVNYNHHSYLAMGKQYQHDGLAALKAYPKRYLVNVAKSTLIYLRPATDNEFLIPNKDRIAPYVKAVEALQGTLPAASRVPARLVGVAVGQMLVFPLVVLWGLYRGVRALGEGPERRAFAVTVLFLALNIVFVTVVGNLVETGENNRFRFDIDMAYMTLFGVLLSDLVGRLRRPTSEDARPTPAP